jgi:hypothetical protein
MDRQLRERVARSYGYTVTLITDLSGGMDEDAVLDRLGC